jgi:RNA:NAD 2'-phosphotransferase (TPT1/KptA family)
MRHHPTFSHQNIRFLPTLEFRPQRKKQTGRFRSATLRTKPPKSTLRVDADGTAPVTPCGVSDISPELVEMQVSKSEFLTDVTETSYFTISIRYAN